MPTPPPPSVVPVSKTRQFFRGLFERTCLAGWMVHMMATTVLIGLSVELIVFSVIFSFSDIELINAGTLQFLGVGGLALLNFPLVMKFRSYGVAHLNFILHEGNLDRTFEAPDAWEKFILAILDPGAIKSIELEDRMKAIRDAKTAEERQELRVEMRIWLMANREQFTPEDEFFVADKMAYLLPPEWYATKSKNR